MGHYSVRDMPTCMSLHELFNRIDQEYMCREHIQCTIIIRVILFIVLPNVYVYVCVCMCM